MAVVLNPLVLEELELRATKMWELNCMKIVCSNWYRGLSVAKCLRQDSNQGAPTQFLNLLKCCRRNLHISLAKGNFGRGINLQGVLKIGNCGPKTMLKVIRLRGHKVSLAASHLSLVPGRVSLRWSAPDPIIAGHYERGCYSIIGWKTGSSMDRHVQHVHCLEKAPNSLFPAYSIWQDKVMPGTKQ